MEWGLTLTLSRTEATIFSIGKAAGYRLLTTKRGTHEYWRLPFGGGSVDPGGCDSQLRYGGEELILLAI